jgi:hypothetical protein
MNNILYTDQCENSLKSKRAGLSEAHDLRKRGKLQDRLSAKGLMQFGFPQDRERRPR